MKPTAIITGITGQDGPYLAQYLLNRGYQVYGLIRRYSNPNLDNLRWLGIDSAVDLVVGDVLDEACINHLVRTVRPTEFYNLAAQSFVGASWDLSKLTSEINAMGPLNCLNSIRLMSPTTKFYQACTSEMFGNSDGSDSLNEQSPMNPRSPYGVSKLFAYHITRNYRESYGLYACSGILFNHESPLRGSEFITRKITKAVAAIKLGHSKSLAVGNLDARRDWGHAADYAEAMYLMLQQPQAEDFVIATHVSHSVRDCLTVAFATIGVDDWTPYVEIDPRFKRPAEIHCLCGDASLARNKLGWQHRISFEQMIREMVEADIQRLSQ